MEERESRDIFFMKGTYACTYTYLALFMGIDILGPDQRMVRFRDRNFRGWKYVSITGIWIDSKKLFYKSIYQVCYYLAFNSLNQIRNSPLLLLELNLSSQTYVSSIF